MEQRKKIKILSWALIFILFINVSAIGTLIYKHNQFKKEYNKEYKFDSKNHQQRVNRKDIYKNFLIEELKLTKKQQEQFDIIRNNFINESHVFFDSIHYYNDLIDDQLKFNDPNIELINKYSSNIGNIHKKLKIRYINYNLQIKDILSEKQKKSYFDAFMKFRNECSYRDKKHLKQK